MSEVQATGLNQVSPPKGNPEQLAAVAAILAWANDPYSKPFFVLEGPAGTGKTFTMKLVIDQLKGKLVFTAPTNKATKVLRESFEGTGYKPECRTIYSLLGLKLAPNGEIKELTRAEKSKDGEDTLDLSEFKFVVVDEAGMINSEVFGEHIKEAVERFGVRFLFMGDPFQLPPVKEPSSPIWRLPEDSREHAALVKVMRHDNQVLNLATAIRLKVPHPAPSIKLASDNDSTEGVWYEPKHTWIKRLAEAARGGRFHSGEAKAIAWRNVTVDHLNLTIRNLYFDQVTAPWVEGDRVIFTEPAKDLEDNIIATTDDEGRVLRVQESWHPIYSHIKIFVVSVDLDHGRLVQARVLHPDSKRAYEEEIDRKSAAARSNGKLWGEFWAFKESFHSLRYAYAITAHRSQGSTYREVFADVQDILLNRNRQEAFRCLYVAVSRPKACLYLT